ncbi:MAG: hypothetical protein JJ971_03990 [Balneolaceae bacterium]|nr:hypothetical protein [Balneolaceae bacterium]MBO6545534.1 hypothetical protein [Balneolaceae bacterium]MBO6646930.1 hypothetical protein [Balneolaceae bacterium]
MSEFKLISSFQPAGDQPTAIADLTEGINAGDKFQTLLRISDLEEVKNSDANSSSYHYSCKK